MRLKLLALTAMSLPLLLAGCAHERPYYPPPPPPPDAYQAIAQQGYHDGVEAARKDMNHGLPPDAERHPRFRRPPVPPPAWEDYRHGFRDGYRQVFEHGGAPPPRAY